MAKWDNKQTRELFRVITEMESEQETKAFLRDLLTERELVEFGKRWQAAKMLNRGISYSNIASETGLSSATIARVSRWLNKSEEGYKKAIDHLPEAN